MVTIKDVAKCAGVSVATVSHVLNKTRYVSQDLVDAVEEAIDELHYTPLRKSNVQLMNNNAVGVIVPDLSVEYYSAFANDVAEIMWQKGITTVVLDSCEKINLEQKNFALLSRQSNISGIIFMPLSNNVPFKTSKVRKPYIVVGKIPDKQKSDIVLPEYEKAAYEAAAYLIRSGHETIGLVLSDRTVTTCNKEYYEGYRSAHRNYRIGVREDSIFFEDDIKQKSIKILFQKFSAVICATDRITTRLLYCLERAELMCPEDLSVVSLEYGMKCHVYQPAITLIGAEPRRLAKEACELLTKPKTEHVSNNLLVRVPNKTIIGASTKIIGRGPFGEKLDQKGDIYLTEEEIQQVRRGNYKGALLFQFSGKRWMRLIDQAVRTVFEKLNIQLIGTFDAASNSTEFINRVREVMVHKPDFLLCAAANDKETEDIYKEIAESGVKLFFIGRVPKGMQKENYECCIVSNEQESGYNCAKILNDYFKGQPANVGLLTCSSSYISGKDRDKAAKRAFEEQFPHLRIIAHEKFTLKNYAYEVCMKMVKEFPDIQGIYVTWEDPAIQTISALMDAGREDIKIVTGDLDTEVAQDMANNHLVIGLSAQLPYAQGEAVSYAAANVLLGKSISKVIGVAPLLVTSENLEDAWYIMTKEKAPRSIAASLLNVKNEERN
ncbi:LacI family DNA-binding transcriptional regulator [Muricomes intestini]|uniref:LacI family DNA-binding transcriptional regulator n=1 Tax=Muricomes intestini TaxID=1796634 RepID=UPI002FDD67EE